MSCCINDSEIQSDSTVFKYKYNQLKNLTKYNCKPACICKIDDQRSNWDVMQYNWVEKGQPMHVKPASPQFQKSWLGYSN